MLLPPCMDVKGMCQNLLMKGKVTGVPWSQGGEAIMAQ